ncbi:winged helix DNA-binding domain-containing protein [Pseudactinotalea sp. HY160]|uniref:winged helix DNA-binding domain-containing protein n=1 Tax=Pseudactinotalea sp. HY160 TaxID=2654490 RepID=UPI00128D1ADE|nr:winged helix DNA-binding domain-containing protein [Pseudactinotalea sp. HY160]MPV48611.1 winged helix DNA-binding domain-containing protein [Pseudactinotalea sp. HY160]
MVLDLTPGQARRLRAQTQLLGGSALGPAEVVARGVALQGQDLPAVLRAVALRSRPGTSLDDVRDAVDAGLLVRSWPMRSTLFLTTPAHLRVLLAATGERIVRATALRRRHLGLDDRMLARAGEVARAALAQAPRTRAELLAEWEAAGIATAAGRGYHLLMHLAVTGLLHWGRFDAGRTQQLVEASAGTGGTADAEDSDHTAAMVAIVRSFIASRAPVSLEDLAWWTKLPKALLRGYAARLEDLVEVTVAGRPAYLLEELLPNTPPPRTGVRLVPGFDEWLLGYSDRSLVATPAALEAVVPGGNGVFRPAILLDGVVVGTWLPARPPARPGPEIHLVGDVTAATARAIDRAIARWPHD